MITVAGLTPSLDLTYLLDRLIIGQIHRTSDVVRCAGGKALNMARAAATMGASSTVVAILGGQTGRLLAAMLRSENISVVVVESPVETRVCVSIASAETGQLTEIYTDAAGIPAEVWDEFQARLEAVLQRSPGWLSISGRAPTGSGSTIAGLIRLGHRLGLQVAVDTHSAALPAAVGERPALVKINRYEAADLLGVATDTGLLAMADAIRGSTGGVVVITDSTAGSLALGEDGAIHAQGPELVGRFPVGSGDSFLGGLLASLDEGFDLSEALRTATACGVANAMVPGQGHFDREAVARIASDVRLRAVA